MRPLPLFVSVLAASSALQLPLPAASRPATCARRACAILCADDDDEPPQIDGEKLVEEIRNALGDQISMGEKIESNKRWISDYVDMRKDEAAEAVADLDRELENVRDSIETKLEPLGRYDSKVDAARAYDRRARTLGRSVNFPRPGEEQTVAYQRPQRVLKPRKPRKRHPDALGGRAHDAARDAAAFEDGLAEVLPLCRLLHSFGHSDTDTLCRVLNTAHRHASAATRARLVYPMCSVIFGCLRAVRRIKTRADAGESVEVGVHKLLAFVATMVQAVAPLAPTLALRLYLQCALAADAAGEEGDAYEFVAQAFIVYEEEISDSRQQVAAIVSCIATLSHMGRLGEEQYETLATKATQYSNKLLKKPDQCRAVCKCAHLFWPPANPSYREGERVLQCLQRTLKLADGCKATAAGTTLFVEALNAYLYHFGVANDHVTAEHLTSLVALVQQHLSADEGDAAAATRAFFTNTRLHLDEKKKADDDAAARFKEIEWA